MNEHDLHRDWVFIGICTLPTIPNRILEDQKIYAGETTEFIYLTRNGKMPTEQT